MIDRFTIELKHEEPVSFVIILHALSIIFEATDKAARDEIASLQRDFDLPEELWQEALRNVHGLVPDCFWLESVESGSSIFKGLLKMIVAGAIGKFAGNAAFDVVKDTAVYQQMHSAAVERIDATWNKAVAYINEPPKQDSSERPRVAAVIVGDRIRFIVTPPKERRHTRSA